MSFDISIYPWNDYHNQDNEHVSSPEVPCVLILLCLIPSLLLLVVFHLCSISSPVQALFPLRPSQWPLNFSSPASPQSAFSRLCSFLFPLSGSSSFMAAVVTHSRSSIICTLTMFLLNKFGLLFLFFIFKMLLHCLWVEYMAFWALTMLWSFIDFSLFPDPKMPVPIWLCLWLGTFSTWNAVFTFLCIMNLSLFLRNSHRLLCL